MSKDADRAEGLIRETSLDGVPLVRRGKVRDLYDLGDRYLIVASDRLSAFDFVLPGGIPDKGRVLTRLSLFWFELLGVENHLISADVDELPSSCAPHREWLRDRFMIVEKLEILPVECIARGYLAGSGWNEYRERGAICGVELPPGLVESSELPAPIFTPSTKAEIGAHDENVSFDEAARRIGRDRAEVLRERTLGVYRSASRYARERGIIIADTKLEWGARPGGEIVLADEVLTPDSSRFWPADGYAPGRAQASFDKQFVRDWLLASDWDRVSPPPALPDELRDETARKYREIYERLTGRAWSR